jgi:hypothetical protein
VVGTAWLPPGTEIAKAEPWLAVVGELAATVKFSWVNPVGPGKAKYSVVGVGVGEADANTAKPVPATAASTATHATTSPLAFPPDALSRWAQ